MLFVGEYKHTLDAKNRIFIPAKMREDLGEHFYITRQMNEACLGVYTREEIDAISEKISKLPDSKVSKLRKFFFSQMLDAYPDSNGRIGLPPALIEHAHIDKTAVIVGVGNHVEIWSEELWTKESDPGNMEEIRDLLATIGL